MLILASNASYAADDEVLYEKALEVGEIVGELDGKAEGKKDFINGEESDWDEDIKSSGEIYTKFSIHDMDYQYRKGFYTGYREKYEEGYEDEYFERLNAKIQGIEYEGSEVDGETVDYEDGRLKGEEYASILAIENATNDQAKGLSNDYLRTVLSDQELISRYNLDKDTYDFKRGFLDGYTKQYKIKYVSVYRTQNSNETLERVQKTGIDAMEFAEIHSQDGQITMEIAKGTLFLKNRISIVNEEKAVSGYKQLTSVYKVVVNEGEGTEFFKDVKLRFKYYGPENASIYELKDGKYIYKNTYIENGKIYTYIKDGYYYGGSYVVVLDTPIDLGFTESWIEKDVELLYRRGILDDYLITKKYLTRAEFIYILSKVFETTEHTALNIMPKKSLDGYSDGNQIPEGYEEAIESFLTLQYMSGYPDGTLRPNKLITVEEVEWLFRKVSLASGFNWEFVQRGLIDEKGVLPEFTVKKREAALANELFYLVRKYVD